MFLSTSYLAAASGAALQHDGDRLTGSNATATLIVGDSDIVECLQLTGPVPSSIGWYDPQGQQVTTDDGDEVYQTSAGGGRVAYLHFQSYQQSQGGRYECRVNVSRNNLENLSVCIGECHTKDIVMCRLSILFSICTYRNLNLLFIGTVLCPDCVILVH